MPLQLLGPVSINPCKPPKRTDQWVQVQELVLKPTGGSQICAESRIQAFQYTRPRRGSDAYMGHSDALNYIFMGIWVHIAGQKDIYDASDGCFLNKNKTMSIILEMPARLSVYTP